nr:MAG TPA: hypothetical protein [Caudoviricetes sp.]
MAKRSNRNQSHFLNGLKHPKKRAKGSSRNIANSNIFQRAATASSWSVTYTHNFPQKLY